MGTTAASTSASAPAGWNQFNTKRQKKRMGEATVQDRYSEPRYAEQNLTNKKEYVDEYDYDLDGDAWEDEPKPIYSLRLQERRGRRSLLSYFVG